MYRTLTLRHETSAGVTRIRRFSGNPVDNGITWFIVSLGALSKRALEPIAAPCLWREMDKMARPFCLANYRKECVAKSAQTESRAVPVNHIPFPGHPAQIVASDTKKARV